jgi:nucleotide-binding universal stress UspA family protein
MSTRKPKVLVGYDGSPEARDALALGELLAEALDAHLMLGFVFASDLRLSSPAYAQERATACEVAEETLRDAPLERFEMREIERIPHTAGSPARGLHELAEWRAVTLLVVGSTHRGPLGCVLPGSVGRRLLDGGPCPVAVAPRGFRNHPRGLRTIVVGYDGCDDSARAVQLAALLALSSGAVLRVVSVVDAMAFSYLGPSRASVLEVVEQSQREKLAQILGYLPAELRVEPLVKRGYVTQELLHEAEEGADLLVLGSRGYGPLRSVLLGSVSSQLIDASPCPLLVVPRMDHTGDRSGDPAPVKASLSE